MISPVLQCYEKMLTLFAKAIVSIQVDSVYTVQLIVWGEICANGSPCCAAIT